MENVIFFLIVALFVVAFIKKYPWIILVAIALAIIGIIIYHKLPEVGGGYSSNSTEPSTNSTSVNKKSTSLNNGSEGELRKKDAWSPTAVYRNGQVFDGFDPWNRIRATYTNGYVYEGTTTGMLGRVIGRYQNGNIYKGEIVSYDNLVGTYSNGKIYKGNSKSMTAEIGSYTGDPSGAAAAAICYLFS